MRACVLTASGGIGKLQIKEVPDAPTPKAGDKVAVQLHEWRRRDQPLSGTITSRLGRTHEPRAELLGIFLKRKTAMDQRKA